MIIAVKSVFHEDNKYFKSGDLYLFFAHVILQAQTCVRNHCSARKY